MAEAVRVAVRVRPFNSREKERNATLIIEMVGNTTKITDPSTGKHKEYTFDFSYWSHNGFSERAEDGYLEADGPGSNYADQHKVMNDLGIGVLQNAWNGYHSCVFAYGQTGSGKSYSIVGYGNNKGIIPQTCAEMFRRVEAESNSHKRFEVEASMLEIYNEKMRDLLNPKVSDKLKIRETKQLGVYVDSLTTVAVKSYSEIEHQMDVGTKHRTVAATNMNATSSRAHTVFTITFKQFARQGDNWGETKSVINLVDLAGSERAESTGATGDRLKEGAAINSSLTALGQVITALAENSSGGKKKVFVPYRNSVLTRLLQSALGGNSKTVMVAALSPADINYEETLSTLRYADNAKKIKTAAVKNEDPTAKMIRELKEENDKLKRLLEGKGGDLSALGGEGMQNEQLEAAQAAAAAAEEEAKAAKDAMLAARAEVEEAQLKMAEFQAKMKMLEDESAWSEELEKLRSELASKDSLIEQLKSSGDADAVVSEQRKNDAEIVRLRAELEAANSAKNKADATYGREQEAAAINRAALEVLDSSGAMDEVAQRRAVRDALAAGLSRSGSTVDQAQVEAVMAKMGAASHMSAIGKVAVEDISAIQKQISDSADESKTRAAAAQSALERIAEQNKDIAEMQKREQEAEEERAKAEQARLNAAIEQAALKVTEMIQLNAQAEQPAAQPVDEESLRAKLIAQLDSEYQARQGTAVMQAAVQRSLGKLIAAAAASQNGGNQAELNRIRADLQKEAEAAHAKSQEFAASADRLERETTHQRKALEKRGAEIATLKTALEEATRARADAHNALAKSRVDRAALRIVARLESGEMSSGSSAADLRSALVAEVEAGGPALELNAEAMQAVMDANLMRLEAAAAKAKVAATSRAQVDQLREQLEEELLRANSEAKKAKDDADQRLADLKAAKNDADTRQAELESLRVELQAAKAAGKGASGARVALAFKGAELQREKERMRARLVAEMEAAQSQVVNAKQSEKSHVNEARIAEEAQRAAQESARIAQEELQAAQTLAQEQAKELAELKGKSEEERKRLMEELERKSQEAARAGDMSKKLDMQRQMKRIADRNKLEAEMKAKAREQLEANERMMEDLGRSWEDKLKQTEELEKGRKAMLSKMGLTGLSEEGVDEKTPHLVNLHEDPLMSGQLFHFVKPGEVIIGSSEDKCGIVLQGVCIDETHCKLTNTSGVVHIEPLGRAVTFVNGKRLDKKTNLQHSARIIIGQNAIFRFADPVEAERHRIAGTGDKNAFKGVIDWDMAQRELHEALQTSVKLKVDEEVNREREAMEERIKEMEAQLKKQKEEKLIEADAEKAAIIEQLRQREKDMEVLREKSFEAEKAAARHEAKAQVLEEERERRVAAGASLGPSAAAVGTMGLGVQRPRTAGGASLGAGMLGIQRPGTASGTAPAFASAADIESELNTIRTQQAAALKHHDARLSAISVAHDASMAEVGSARDSMDAGLEQYKMDLQRIEDELRTSHPAVLEANAIADAMGRKVEIKTHVRIEAPEVMGLSPVQELLQVRRAALEFWFIVIGDSPSKKRTTVWTADEFWRRLDRFREAHAYYLKHNRQPFDSKKDDPFYAAPAPEPLGKAVLFLKPLSHAMRLQTWAPILDASGKSVGELQLAIQPTQPDFVSGARPVLDPSDAIGQQSAAVVRVQQARNLPSSHSTNVFVKYTTDGMEERTSPIAQGRNQNPRLDHRDHLVFGEVTPALINFFARDALTFEVVAEPDDVEEGLVTEAPKTAASAAGANPYDGGELPPEVFDFNIAIDLLEGGVDADAGEGAAPQFERCHFDGGSNALGVASGIFTVTHGRPKRILLQCMQGQTQLYPIKHVVSAWIGRVQDVYGNEVEKEQVPLQVLSLSTTPDGRTTNIVANWFRGPPLCDQLSPEGAVFFPTVTLEVELRNLDLASPIPLTKMFAMRVEGNRPTVRSKSYFGFSRKPKPGGSAAEPATVDEKTQFDGDQARSRLQKTGAHQQVKAGTLERSDEAVTKQQAEMKRLLEKESAVSEGESKRKLIGDATSQIDSLQKALQAEESRQDKELQRALVALRQMMP